MFQGDAQDDLWAGRRVEDHCVPKATMPVTLQSDQEEAPLSGQWPRLWPLFPPHSFPVSDVLMS